MLVAVLIICLFDISFAIYVEQYPYATNFLRPVVVMIFLNQIRSNLKSVFKDLIDSLAILIIIFGFVFFFAFSGYFLFQGQFEGLTIFPDLGDSYYNLVILLTTANFPDVMLPAYNEHRFSCLFFLIFLIIGLYFFFNILLAIVFDNYKAGIENKVEHKN